MLYFAVFSLIASQNSKKQLLDLTPPYFIVFSPIAVKKQSIFFVDVEVGIPKFGILAPPLWCSPQLGQNPH
jgi:hypothetical protein